MDLTRKMISFQKILIFSATIMGIVMIFCEANVLISNKMKKEEKYRMDLEIFKVINRYYTVYRRAEVSEMYEKTGITSKFNFFFEFDDDPKELIHYMDFIGTSGIFFNNLTLSYSILYTKYTAVIYAANILNIYKIKKKEFESWDNDTSIHELLKKNKKLILDVYLKVGQYFAWYASIGNDVFLEEIEEKLSKKNLCAVKPYTEFKDSFNNILDKMDTAIFQTMSSFIREEKATVINVDDFWKDIYKESTTDIQIINRYFTSIFSGAAENAIEINDFINAVQKESFIEGFVSDLSIMKGRDIEETYSNFDYDNKKNLYKADVTSVINVIESKEMESSREGLIERKKAEKNEEYLTLLPIKEDELYTCLKFELKNHETFFEEKNFTTSGTSSSDTKVEE